VKQYCGNAIRYLHIILKTGMWYGKELCERNKKWGNKEREVYGKYGRWCEPAETGYVATHWMRLPKPFEK